MSRLLLVRHGETKHNDAIRFWGRTDIPLSDEGIRQAERLRDRLAAQPINAAYASSLSRSINTAEIIASGHDLDIRHRPELDELDFGTIEGLTFDEIQRFHPELARVMGQRHARPSFPGGESLDELDTRVREFLKCLEEHQPEETVLIVAHFATLRVMICNLMELGLEHWQQLQISFASLSIIDTSPHGVVLRLLNDVSHLQTREEK